MTPERHQQIGQLYHAVLELAPTQRVAFLAQACADDEALRREVESLLALHAEAGDFFAAPALEHAAKTLADEQAQVARAERLGHYRIIALLGAGGMGEVYLAQDLKLGRKLALKLLPTAFTAAPDRLRRFEQEARAASALNHPNIITIYEVGEVAGTHYIATEFVDGQTLRQQMAGERLSLLDALEIVLQVASALAAAHEAGIIHRDIKPENVMRRRDGLVKVLDFGLAKLTEARIEDRGLRIEDRRLRNESIPCDLQSSILDPQSTASSMVMGTVGYMSPEQARGLKVDARTDIFSLGIVLYELIAGRAPFEGATSMDVLAAILHFEPLPLRQHAPTAPAELQHIVSKALSKERDERYQTTKDLLLDLKSLKQELELEVRVEKRDAGGKEPAPTTATVRAAQTGGGGVTRQTSSAEYLFNQAKSHPRAALSVLVTLLLIIAGAAFYFLWLKREATTVARIKTIAVLPFRPLTLGQPVSLDDEYLGPGMTDALIRKLSNLRQVAVRPTSAVMKYANANYDLIAVGHELKVEALLDGRIQRNGNRVRVTVQLLNARDGVPQWAESFDERFTDLFKVQDAISEQVAGALLARIGGAERKLLVKRETENIEAQQLYLQGRFYWERRTQEGFKKSIDLLHRSLEKDPNYGLAHAGLGSSYALLSIYGFLPPRDAMPRAEAAANRALELDESLAEAHIVRGVVLSHYKWDLPAAERELLRAIELNRNQPNAHHVYALVLAAQQRYDEARAQLELAQTLDPRSLNIVAAMAWVAYLARQYEQAVAICQKLLKENPDFSPALQHLGETYTRIGKYDEAIAALEKARARSGNSTFAVGRLGQAYAAAGRSQEARQLLAELEESANRAFGAAWVAIGLGERGRAIQWLEKAYEDHAADLIYLRADSIYDSLREEARFNDLVQRVGLAPGPAIGGR
jgi:eukaryotic-like serine/threonine-protein kinase